MDTFNKFFAEKIYKIRSSFPDPPTVGYPNYFIGVPLSEFRAAIIPEIQSILKEFGIKTASIDPFPVQS